MLPTDFPGSNIVLDKPDSATDDQCMSGVPAWRGEEAKTGFYCHLFAWKPSKEDIDSILAGNPIFLKIYAVKPPPHSVFTLNSEGETND